MAAVAPDVMACAVSPISDDGQSQSAAALDAASTPFPVLAADTENSEKTLRGRRPLPPTPVSAWTRRASSGSTSRSPPPSILVSTDPVVEVTVPAETPEAPIESESSPSSESESQGLEATGSSQTTLTSSSSSSGFEPDSAASSTRTRATTLSSASVAPCVTFAPLPEIGPRKRNSSRPIGLAARGQILRQRRLMMAQEKLTYYEEEVDTIPGGERMGGRVNGGNDRTRRSDLDETDDAIAALGKMLGDATKIIWRRMSHAKLKSNGSSRPGSKPFPKQSGANRSFTWPGRLRAASIASAGSTSSPTCGQDSDDDSEDDIDGPWRRRRNEDPMTKTIVEGSDDGHGLEQFVLAYDTIPACEEEEEDHINARADEEIRTTVEVHLVKAAEGESEE